MSDIRASAVRLAGVPVTVGLVVGILGAFAWRHLALRRLVDTNPPYVPPGKRGYMFVVNYLEYIYGPAWWPVIVILPAIGLGFGAATGLIAWFSVRRRTELLTSLSIVLAGAVSGALVGVCTAAIARSMPPTVGFRNGTGPAPDIDINDMAGFPNIVGAPPYWDLRPGFLCFGVAGSLTAAVIAGVCVAGLALLRRQHGGPSVASARGEGDDESPVI